MDCPQKVAKDEPLAEPFSQSILLHLFARTADAFQLGEHLGNHDRVMLPSALLRESSIRGGVEWKRASHGVKAFLCLHNHDDITLGSASADNLRSRSGRR